MSTLQILGNKTNNLKLHFPSGVKVEETENNFELSAELPNSSDSIGEYHFEKFDPPLLIKRKIRIRETDKVK